MDKNDILFISKWIHFDMKSINMLEENLFSFYNVKWNTSQQTICTRRTV
jgi:hypothetical protein